MSREEIEIFALLKRAAIKNHLGHALLLVSPSTKSASFEAGLNDFVGFLMCSSQTKSETLRACGQCESCQAFHNSQSYEGVHTDLLRLRSESKVGYSVDQIKELRTRLSLHRGIAQERVVVLEDAEDLSGGAGGAANALLKILEEPRPDTRLLLLSSRPEGILATIRSRCQIFRVPLKEPQTSALSPEALEAWGALWHWLERGAPTREWAGLALPANADGFFKEREAALDELRAVFQEAWMRSRHFLAQLPAEASRELVSWFQDFEELLSALRSHGQGGLQWSAFKTRAKSRIS